MTTAGHAGSTLRGRAGRVVALTALLAITAPEVIAGERGEQRILYLGQGRYVCQGSGFRCEAFNARERQYQESRAHEERREDARRYEERRRDMETYLDRLERGEPRSRRSSDDDYDR